MHMTVTIRIDEALRTALEERARARGTTVSSVAREILREALEDRPVGLRTEHLRGRLALEAADQADSWRAALRDHNRRS